MATRPGKTARSSDRTATPSKGANSEKFSVDPSMRIIVLAGKDTFQIASRTQEIIDTLEDKFGEIERFSYDGETAALADVLDELRSYGLIQRHKLVILDKAEEFLAADDRRRPAMEAYAAAPVEDATLLMRAETWRAGKLDKAIAQVGAIFKVEPIDEVRAVGWCVKRCEKRHEATMSREAAERLVTLIGADLGRLDMEIAKLASFVGGGGNITPREVAQLVGLSREDEVWSIQSPIAAGDRKATITMLHDMMTLSRQPEGTRTLISWAVCDLLRKIHAAAHLLRQGVQPFQAAKQIKLWGASSQPILDAAKRTEPAVLAALLDDAIRMDANSKSGLGDAMRSLEVLALRIADTMGRPRS